MSVIHITKDNFSKEVIKSKKPVLIDFWANWCVPCKMLSPVVDEIAAEAKDIIVGKVNVEEEQELATLFEVMSIPMLVLIKDGRIAAQTIGLTSKANIASMINV